LGKLTSKKSLGLIRTEIKRIHNCKASNDHVKL